MPKKLELFKSNESLYNDYSENIALPGFEKVSMSRNQYFA